MSFAPTGYCDSKLMNGVLVKEVCKTELARNVHFPLTRKIMMLPFLFFFVRTSHQGAQNIIHATIQDLDMLQNGGFYRDGKLSVRENEKLELLSETGKELYDVSLKMSKVHTE